MSFPSRQKIISFSISFRMNCQTIIIVDLPKQEILECNTMINGRKQVTRIEQSAIKLIKQIINKKDLHLAQIQKNIQKQLPQLFIHRNDYKLLGFKECLIGGGNILSQSESELKHQKDKIMDEWLGEQGDEQKSCIYVKNCIQELKKMIEELTHLQSNSKTYCFQKFKDFNQVFFENTECHPLLLEFFELCADRLLFQQNKTQLIATEDQKQELIKQMDSYITILQSFQNNEPLQNHIFYLKLIRQIFFISKSIQTAMQKFNSGSQSVFQIFVVIYKQDKNSLKLLLDKCRNICSAFRQCDKIGGIIKYTEIILQNLDLQLTNCSLSTNASFSSQDFSRQSTGDYSRQGSINPPIFNSQSFNQVMNVKNSSDDQYDIELQVRHMNMDLTSHFRVQYYALMQIDKLIQRMIEDPSYQVNESPSSYFPTFIHDNQRGIISYSEKQYWFKKLENLSFERNVLLRYISLSILIRCYELFTLKSPNNHLLKDILDAIYFRYYFEPHQKIYILILKNKELLKAIQNMNSKEQSQILRQKAYETSQIIESSEQQQKMNRRSMENENDLEQFSFNSESQEDDLFMMKSRINFIKNDQGQLFIQSRINHQNYIQQQHNLLPQKNNYIEQYAFSFNDNKIPIKDIQQTLIKQFFNVKNVPTTKVIVVQGRSGSGKTTLAVNIHQSLITLIKELHDPIQSQPNQRNHNFKSCMVSFGANPFIFTPILLKLQNMNLKNASAFFDSLPSEFQALMSSSEYKVLIIDGLNQKNQKELSEILSKSSINEWKNFIFLITSTTEQTQRQGILSYNQSILNFLCAFGIQNQNLIEGYQLTDFKPEQVSKYLENQCSNLRQIKVPTYNNKEQVKSQQEINEQDNLAKYITDSITNLQQFNLSNNPLNLYQLYKVYYQFHTINLEQIKTEEQLLLFFFQSHFCQTFKHWKKLKINNQTYFSLLQQSYIYFFQLIAKYMNNNNQNFISIDVVHGDILDQITKNFEILCKQSNIFFSKENSKNNKTDEVLLDLYEQFNSGMERYFNSDIFEKVSIANLNAGNKQKQIENICFKHDKYFQYFLSLK